MIFLTVGSSWYPFDRLIKSADLLAGSLKEEQFFMQTGAANYEPRFAEWKNFLDFNEMLEKINNANVVISHAGAGSILLCLKLGKKPLVIPRDPNAGEAIDTHQEQLCRRLEKQGYLSIVEDLDQIKSYITHARLGEKDEILEKADAPLLDYLNGLVHQWFPDDKKARLSADIPY